MDIDLFFSNNVLEHIPGDIINKISNSLQGLCKQLSKPIYFHHIVDLSDHFSHSDNNISSISFLKWSKLEWALLSGNRFMYQNRMRVSEYLYLFQKPHFKNLASKTYRDSHVEELIKHNNLNIHKDFKRFSTDELTIITLEFSGKIVFWFF